MQNKLTTEQWLKHGTTLRGVIAWKRQAEERLKKLLENKELDKADWYLWRGVEHFINNLDFNFEYNVEYKHFTQDDYIKWHSLARSWERSWLKRIRDRKAELEVAKGYCV